NTLIVPNSELVNTKILNLSQPSRGLACGATIKAPYEVPFSRLKAICSEVIDRMTTIDLARGKWVNLSNLTETGQVISVGFWVSDLDQEGAAVSEFNEKLLERMQTENLQLASWQGFV